jgi:formate dehydrogenase subunit gamma
MTSTPGWAGQTATEAPAPSTEDLIRRFSGAERAAHWLVASTFLAMLATGLVLYLPSLAQIAADRQSWKSIHIGAAGAFWVGLGLIVALSSGELRQTASEIETFDDDDRRWLAWSVRRQAPAPPQGRFNAGQKLNAAIVAGLIVVFNGSGILIYAQETDAAFRGQTSAILVHDLATYAALPLILGHLYLALIHPETRHSLRGMVSGSVRRDWALRHHAKWAVTTNDQPHAMGRHDVPAR